MQQMFTQFINLGRVIKYNWDFEFEYIITFKIPIFTLKISLENKHACLHSQLLIRWFLYDFYLLNPYL